MAKRLSVIVPGYNTPEAWWKRCVDSVLRAIGPEDEVILVDDGSCEDLGVRSFESLQTLDARLCILRKENGGLSSARNAGMAAAQGEYITFVDSDDEVTGGVFERCLEQIKKTGSDVCIYGVRTIWVDDGLQKVDSCDNRVYGRLSACDVYDLSCRCLMNYAWNKVYLSDLLRTHKVSFDIDGMPCEDIIFNLNCVMAGAKWCSIDHVGYLYYRTRGTLLSKYKRTGFVGIRHGAEAWQRFAMSSVAIDNSELRRWVMAKGVLTDEALAAVEWRNIWMPGSPYSLFDRWQWLRGHESVGGFLMYLKMAIYMFFRRHFYIRPIRRWNIRRQYPYATEWSS